MKKTLNFYLLGFLVLSCNPHHTSANNIASEKESLPNLENCHLTIHKTKFDCMEANTHFKAQYKDMTIEQIQKAFIHIPEQCGVTEIDVSLYTYCAIHNR